MAVPLRFWATCEHLPPSTRTAEADAHTLHRTSYPRDVPVSELPTSKPPRRAAVASEALGHNSPVRLSGRGGEYCGPALQNSVEVALDQRVELSDAALVLKGLGLG